MNNIIKRVWNQNRMVNIEDLRGMAFQAEDGGHTFEISGINDANEAVSLSGTVAGVFMRPDGTDVALTGTASEGVVSVTLSDACYAVAGRFGLTIFVTADNNTTCVYACIGTVAQSSYGTVAGDTPQNVVDLINAINAAIASIPADYTYLMAAIAPTYSAQSVYPAGAYRWYNGVLYKSKVAITTAESFTAAHWETVALADDVSELKTIVDSIDGFFARNLNLEFTLGGYINATTGNVSTLATAAYTPKYYPVSAGMKLETNVKGNGSCAAVAFYDANLGIVSGTSVSKNTYTSEEITVPDNNTIAYARFSAEYYETRYDVTPYCIKKSSKDIPQIGELSELETFYKADTVGAINEVNTKVNTKVNEKEYIYRESVKDENKLYVQKEWSLATTDWTAIHTILTADGDSLIMACNDTIRSTHFAKNVMTDKPIDLSHSNIGIDFDVITGTPGERTSYLEISEIDILLTSNNGYADATSDKFRIINNSSHILYDGNYKVSIPLDVTRNIHAPSIVDLTAVNGVAIQISTIPHTNEAGRESYDGMPSIKINKLFSFRKPNRKQVMFGFDNAYMQQLEALEYLNDAGITGTLFFPYGVIGDDGRMTTQNIRMLESKGNLISIYGSLQVTPSKYWYDMTLAEKKSAIALQADWSYRNAFGKGAKYMSTPAGGYAKDEDALVTGHFVDLITGRINVSVVPIPTPFYTNLTHQGHAVGPAGTTANRKMAIDSLISSGGFVIFIFHQCAGQTDDITLQAFKDIVDYVKQKKELGLLEVVNADGIISNYELAYPPTI